MSAELAPTPDPQAVAYHTRVSVAVFARKYGFDVDLAEDSSRYVITLMSGRRKVGFVAMPTSGTDFYEAWVWTWDARTQTSMTRRVASTRSYELAIERVAENRPDRVVWA